MEINKAHIRLFINVSLISFLITLSISYLYLHDPHKKAKSFNADIQPVNDLQHVQAVENNPLLEDTQNVTGQKLSRQVKPGFSKLPLELFSGHHEFYLNFHKIPAEYLTPAGSEKAKQRIAKIRELSDADLKTRAAIANISQVGDSDG